MCITSLLEQTQYLWFMCTVTLQLDPSVDARDAVPEVGPRAALALAHGPSREARVLDHLGERGLRRELADALDQILVRGAVAGEDRAEERDDRERVLVVDPVVSYRLAVSAHA